MKMIPKLKMMKVQVKLGKVMIIIRYPESLKGSQRRMPSTTSRSRVMVARSIQGSSLGPISKERLIVMPSGK